MHGFTPMAALLARGETRRGVSRALGGSGLGILALAGLAPPRAGEARRKSKKRKKRSQGKQDANRLCKRQLEPCRASVAKHCQLDPVFCEAAAGCCSHAAQCRLTEFFSCLVLPTTANATPGGIS